MSSFQTKIAPLVLFIYNRPEHTKKTLEALSANLLISETELFIFADGPKDNASEEQLNKIKETRTIAKKYNCCKTVNVIESDKNKGLAASIISGVTDIVNRFGKVIVLEDDLITSPYFLKYMNEALSVYENDTSVACIHGYVEPHKKTLPETFFLKGADCWGWATWKRAWEIFNPNGQELLDEINLRKCEKHFNFDNSYNYVGMLEDQIAGRNNSWAIRWQASAYLKDMYCLYPNKTLVNNVGFDGSGTHCQIGKFFQGSISTEPVNVIYQIPKQCKDGFNAYKAIYLFRKRGNKTILSFIFYKLFNMIKIPFRPLYHVIKKL